MIKVDSGDIDKLYVGSTEITKAYVGSQLVYENSATPVLPYDAEVTYLQGDGDSYVDSGIKASNLIGIEGTFQVLSAFSGISSIFGSRVANNDTALTLQYYKTSSTKYWRWGFGNNANTVNHNGTVGNYNISNTESTNILVVTGARNATATCASATFSNNYNIFILAMNNGGTAAGLGGNAYIRVKSCKIYNDGTLARDYIPVRVGTVGYLYDKVSCTLFGNAGGGSFTVGADVT